MIHYGGIPGALECPLSYIQLTAQAKIITFNPIFCGISEWRFESDSELTPSPFSALSKIFGYSFGKRKEDPKITRLDFIIWKIICRCSELAWGKPFISYVFNVRQNTTFSETPVPVRIHRLRACHHEGFCLTLIRCIYIQFSRLRIAFSTMCVFIVVHQL